LRAPRAGALTHLNQTLETVILNEVKNPAPRTLAGIILDSSLRSE